MSDTRDDQRKRLELAERRLQGVLETLPAIVWESWDPKRAGDNTDYVSDYVEIMTGYTPAEWSSDPDFWLTLVPPEDREATNRDSIDIDKRGSGTLSHRWRTKDGRLLHVETYMHVVKDASGEAIGVHGVTFDVTARKRAEEEQARLQQEIIDVQARMLAELSTPLIPISKEVLVMPLIGALDQTRADGVIQTLLAGISTSRARVAILDITGVPGLDTRSADAILRAAKAVRLLGAQVVLTGIRPEVAQTLVVLGADLTGIATRGTLEDGIAFAQRL